MAAMVPAPIFFQKKEGKFNSDDIIELVEQKQQNDSEEEQTKKLDQELKS